MSYAVSLSPILFQIEPPVEVLGVSQPEHELPLLAALLLPLLPLPPSRRGRPEVAADGALADEGRQGHPHPQQVDVKGAHQVPEKQRLDGGLRPKLEESLLRGPS